MRRSWPIALFVACGCSSAEFDVPAATDSAVTTDDVAVAPDTSGPGVDTSVVADDTAVAADVNAPDVCPPNACGGCGTLAKPPGTVCGVCMTSTYECAGMTATACKLEDDRTDGQDSYFKTYDGNGISAGDTTSPAAIAFKTMRAGSPTSLTLAMQRYDVEPTSAAGLLRVRLIKGLPTMAVTSGAVVATSSIAGDLVPGTPGTVIITLPAGLPSLAAGTQLWIEVVDQSDRYNFAVNGAMAAGAADLDFYYVQSTTGLYTKYATIDPYLVVGLRACF